MQLRSLLLIFFSILLAVSEAATIKKPTKGRKTAAANRKASNRRTAAGIQKPAVPKPPKLKAKIGKFKTFPAGGKETPTVDSNKHDFKTKAKPSWNPWAQDNTKSPGHRKNPIAIHYNPQTQPDQTQIIKQTPHLGQPFLVNFKDKQGTRVRDARFAAHKKPKPGKSPEDQPPASFGNKPGKLFNITPAEQKRQGGRISRAYDIATGPTGWVQQVIWSGSNGAAPDPIPPKVRRDLLISSLLARKVERLSIANHPGDELNKLYARFDEDQSLLAYW